MLTLTAGSPGITAKSRKRAAPDSYSSSEEHVGLQKLIPRRCALASEPPVSFTPVSPLQAVVLGIVQGLTEFAPVSSSGHLILIPWMFGWHILDDPELNKSFDVALHSGTLLGALAYFREDVRRYARALLLSARRRPVEEADARIAWALVIGTVPSALVGALGEGVIQNRLGAPLLIAVMLAVFGVLLYVVDRRAPASRGIDDVGIGDGLKLGIAQAIALQPGVSRSGVTIMAARAFRFDREAAARFSFLLSMPVIFGAAVFEGLDVARRGLGVYAVPFLWGMLSSAVTAFLVIWTILAYLRRRNFAVFMWYRLALAGVVLVLIGSGVLPATS